MYNPFHLSGKTILVTGASSGIGRATAIEISRLGGRLIISGRREEALSETLSQLQGEGHEMRICDLSDQQELDAFCASLPPLDGIVNNAGTNHQVPVPFIKPNDLYQVMDVNTMAPIVLLSKLVKQKKIKKGSSVVFTNSIAGLGKVSTGNTIYATSKGALTSFVMGAAKELASKSIRVNAVCPGMVETAFIGHHVTASDELLDADRQSYPLQRYGRPEEVAWAIIYLLSDASAWVTGTNMVIDGGRSLK